MSLTDLLATILLTIGLVLIFSLIPALGFKSFKRLINLDFSDIPWNAHWKNKFAFRVLFSSILVSISQYLLLYQNVSLKILILSSAITPVTIIGLIKFNKWDNHTLHTLFAQLWGLNFIFIIYLLCYSRGLSICFVIGLIIYFAVYIISKKVFKIKGKLLEEILLILWLHITVILVVL